MQFAKEGRHARWRAYAKGCLDLCDRFSSQAIKDRANLNDVAPKDVKQLEVLKPLQTPSMGERHKQSLEKEKRQEVATRPVQKTTTHQQEEKMKDSEGGPFSKNKRKKKKVRAMASAGESARDGSLDQEDEVEEGINWSDEEE
jgi:hypothetical protein